jgi:hypothetical protein
MGSPQSVILNFVHTADEPADLVRELGLLFKPNEIAELLAETQHCDSDHAQQLCETILSESPFSELGLEPALTRLRDQLHTREARDRNRGPAGEILGVIKRIRQGDCDSWPAVRARLSSLGVLVDEIDDIVISGWTAPRHRQDRTEEFPSCERIHWQSYPFRPPAQPEPSAAKLHNDVGTSP